MRFLKTLFGAMAARLSGRNNAYLDSALQPHEKGRAVKHTVRKDARAASWPKVFGRLLNDRHLCFDRLLHQ